MPTMNINFHGANDTHFKMEIIDKEERLIEFDRTIELDVSPLTAIEYILQFINEMGARGIHPLSEKEVKNAQ